jgi:hypothetical protein
MKSGKLVSHGGLTFGGIISGNKMKIKIMLALFESLIQHVRENSATKIIYKAIPHIYHTMPSEEDLYALFVNKAKLVRRDFSASLRINNKPRLSKGRKHAIRKAKKMKLKVLESDDFETFMLIEEFLLAKYHGARPVHTAKEIAQLAKKFPENIKLFGAYKRGQMLAGTIIYESRGVAHTQYIASTDEGKKIGANDVIFDYLMSDYYVDKRYFDFGISTERNSVYLNGGLAMNKESYGARGIVYDRYEIDLRS